MLKNLAKAVQRHIPRDGMQQTSINELTLYRSSSTTEHDAAVYEPALIVMAQGTKEVVLGDMPYRYDPDHYLLVSVDLAVSARVLEATPNRPSLALRIVLDLAVVGELLAEGTVVPSLGEPERGLAVTQIDEHLRDAVARLVEQCGLQVQSTLPVTFASATLGTNLLNFSKIEPLLKLLAADGFELSQVNGLVTITGLSLAT